MDATCKIQDSILVFSLVRKYVSRILGTYHFSKYHIILSIILLFAGIHLLTDDKQRKADLYYFAVTFVNNLIIICPVFFELGRTAVRNI